ncbi:hypothetical protein PTI98_000404 [Pleurotus ostreatus]|nr:hypothetical protein PTI98_000404 [Pleurotus ostreatus]
MNSPLDRIVIECCLSDARFNPAQNIEMPRIRAVPTTQPPSPLTGRISEVTPLQEGEFTQVYRGTLRIPGSKAIDVVIKTDAYAAVARPAAFKREINAYERKLHSWQGYLIPNCYGLYQVEDDDQVVSFLVLEFSGLPIDFNVEYPEDLKAEILNKLSTLHRAGFCHGDLEDYNIVVDDGQVMFIDLEDVEPHECQVKQAIIPDDLVPASAEFGCKEIYHIAYMLKVWQKRFVHFYGHDFNLSEIKPGGAGHLLRISKSGENGTIPLQTKKENTRSFRRVVVPVNPKTQVQVHLQRIVRAIQNRGLRLRTTHLMCRRF